jgi:hypothetical protein
VRRPIAALAALLIVIATLPGAALCVGSEGHLAVEAIGSDCAPGPFAGLARSAPAPSGGDLSLHGCTDTPLGYVGLKSTAQSSGGEQLAATRRAGADADLAVRAPRVPAEHSPAARGRHLSTVLRL